MKLIKTIVLGLGLLLGSSAFATSHDFSEGEVRRIDQAGQRITLRHGPIDNLKMPPMTMVFRVTVAEQLELLAPGDKVRFRAEQQDSGYVVTELEKVE